MKAMKKVLALIMAGAMTLGMATTVMAVGYTASEPTSFGITKEYTSTETWVPGETLSFDINADEGNPDTEMISIGTGDTYTVTDLENTITVTVPSYDTAGVYNYTIREIAGSTAGVTTYDTEKTIYVSVLVEYDNINHKLVIGNDEENGVTYFIKKEDDGTKTDEFINVFETADFSVAKDVRGNMANENDEFEITVTLTTTANVLTPIKVGGTEVSANEWKNGTYTTTLTLSENDGATTFEDIPYGVEVSVEEEQADDKMGGYTYVSGDTEFTVGADTEEKAVVIVNEKTTSVETGIGLDSLPYITLLILVCGAAVLFFVNRRRSMEF